MSVVSVVLYIILYSLKLQFQARAGLMDGAVSCLPPPVFRRKTFEEHRSDILQQTSLFITVRIFFNMKNNSGALLV